MPITGVEGDEPCGKKITPNLDNVREPITLQFPTTAGNYAPNQYCRWDIVSPPDTLTILKFLLFELEAMTDRRTCRKDKLEIRAGAKPIGR